MEELERLGDLRDKGLLTEEQFDEQRSRIVPPIPSEGIIENSCQHTAAEKLSNNTSDLDTASTEWDKLLNQIWGGKEPRILRNSKVIEIKEIRVFVKIYVQELSITEASKLEQWQPYLGRQLGNATGNKWSEVQFVTPPSRPIKTGYSWRL